tara:strand:+ start:1461 stop:3449 length:1989 start_codon:yes stop_codon:yes gene_type:complete
MQSTIPDLWYSVLQEKQRFLREGLIKSDQPSFSTSSTAVQQPSFQQRFGLFLYRVYIILAYLSLALSSTYSAVINLGLLHLPTVVYVSFVCLIGVASFTSSVVDWILTQTIKPNRYPTEKIRSIENRFFLHNADLRQLKTTAKVVPQALRAFSTYAYLEKLVRKQVKLSLVFDRQIYSEDFDDYPIELQARCMLSERARNSRDHRQSIIESAQSLAQSYGILKDIISRNVYFEYFWSLSKCDDLRPENINTIYKLMKRVQSKEDLIKLAQSLNQAERDNIIDEDKKIDPSLIATYSIARFACYARSYYTQLSQSSNNRMDEQEIKNAMKNALQLYLDKRIKKERDLSYATREIGFVANVLVWGSALISNALTIVASAPIKLLSNWSGLNIESLLCVWFYASGCLIGISVENAQKFLARIVRHLHESDYQSLAPFLRNRVFRFRLFLVAATAISSCYFSMFGILRLIKNPQEHGAEFIIEFLSKQLIPQIWPCIVPIWAVLTLVSAMMNLYKDSKFYSSYVKRLSNCQTIVVQIIRSQGLTNKHRNSSIRQLLPNKSVSKIALVTLLTVLSVAIALTYHVTVMQLTQSMAFSAVLSTCVFFMNYAKFTSLYHKIKDLAVTSDSPKPEVAKNTNSKRYHCHARWRSPHNPPLSRKSKRPRANTK